MDLAELFKRTERILAANEQLRLKLKQTLSQAQRSLNQHPDPQTAARIPDDWGKKPNHASSDIPHLAIDDAPPPN
ncbi:hypothetical protein [Lacipirellula parvula]|uniref:Uncharacterized protein n=1 Tax=Lacipirellula parvula TaxID=2650471 RepID=A0A5K7XH72_9BACT|nr:hypothetical protein [Lacipirellula parvula]BBO35735.1 hypothetical protein PLANPX_5347 [Lacipirellula parvula]